MKKYIKSSIFSDYKYSDLIDDTKVKIINKAIQYAEYEIPDNLMDELQSVNNALNAVYDKISQQVVGPVEEKKREAKEAKMIEKSVKVSLTQSQADLVDAVLGQLSDGYWSNNKYYEKIWKYLHLRGTTLYVDITPLRYAGYSDRHIKDAELLSNPTTAKQWFAKRAQTVQNEDLRYNFDTTRIRGHEDEQAEFLNRGVNQTYGQIQEAINSLK